ncbi:MAG: DUF2179 domain-containing protein [Mycoplasma sp.]
MHLKPRTKPKKVKRTVSHGNFSIGRYRQQRIKAKGLKFATLYDDNAVWKRYLICAIVGVLAGALVQFMIKNTGLYNTGLSSIVQGFARLIYTIMSINEAPEPVAKLVFNLLFWVAFFIANIPLMILGYYKIGKLFTKLTFTFLLSTTLTGFGLSYIPGIETVMLFGNTRPSYHLNVNGDRIDNYLWIKCHISVIPFWYNGEAPTYIDNNKWIIYEPDYDPFKSLFLLLYGVVYGIGIASLYSVLYIVGGSSGGMDFIGFYYSVKHQKSINNVLSLVAFSSMLTGVIIGSYIPSGIAVSEHCWKLEWFFSANLVSSIIAVFVFKTVLSRLYPSTQQCKVEIYTSKVEEVIENLKKSRYNRSLSSSKIRGSYSKKERDVLWTVCFYNELPRLIYHIREEDPNCLITAILVRDIDGVVNVLQQGSIEI